MYVLWLLLLLLTVCIFVFFKTLLTIFFIRRAIWRLAANPYSYTKKSKLFWNRAATSDKLEQYSNLLKAAGLNWPASPYLWWRKAVVAFCLVVLIVFWFNRHSEALSYLMSNTWVNAMMFVSISAVCLASSDKLLFDLLAKHRNRYLVNEIYTLCKQLLYYSSSKSNLHHRLRKCTAHTQRIRKEWLLLIHEWYEDPEKALHRFADRLGTPEAYRLSQTLNAIRLFEHDSYYKLLHERVQDYKEKIELYKEGRKETTSYVLFVLAGIPILYTFRLFIHPWVSEGQRLFELLQ